MISDQDCKAIRVLQAKGYNVVVSNPRALLFNQRYMVYAPSERLLGRLIHVDGEGQEIDAGGSVTHSTVSREAH